jgi:hypothetical protein
VRGRIAGAAHRLVRLAVHETVLISDNSAGEREDGSGGIDETLILRKICQR